MEKFIDDFLSDISEAQPVTTAKPAQVTPAPVAPVKPVVKQSVAPGIQPATTTAATPAPAPAPKPGVANPAAAPGVQPAAQPQALDPSTIVGQLQAASKDPKNAAALAQGMGLDPNNKQVVQNAQKTLQQTLTQLQVELGIK